MTIKKLVKRSELKSESKTEQYFNQLNNFLNLISEKDLSITVVENTNSQIDRINNIEDNDKLLKKALRKVQNELLRLIVKEDKLVTINYYRNTWMMLGMGAIGVPLGTAFGLANNNMGLIGIGLPIGMAIGIAIGVNQDKKAKKYGNQIDIEIKF
jgi:hypothetical protein